MIWRVFAEHKGELNQAVNPTFSAMKPPQDLTYFMDISPPPETFSIMESKHSFPCQMGIGPFYVYQHTTCPGLSKAKIFKGNGNNVMK